MTFRPGQTGNAGGRPKLTEAERQARALAKEATPKAVQALIDLLDETKNGDKRLRKDAAKEILALTRVKDESLWDLPDELTQRPQLEQKAAIQERIRRLQLVEAQLSSGSPQKPQKPQESPAKAQGSEAAHKAAKGTAAA